MRLSCISGCLLVLCFGVSFSLSAKDAGTTNQRDFQKPLCFVENKGQILDINNKPRADVHFKMSSPGMNLFICNGRLHYQFSNVNMREKAPEISTYDMDVSLVGANSEAKFVATGKLDYHENYYLAQTGSDGVTAEAYTRICYKEVYPGIDWVVYVNDSKIEYDFVVRPGGNPSDIKIKYDGATSLEVKADGSLQARTPMGFVEEKHPIAFETRSHRPVDSKFTLKDNIVGFQTSPYKGSLTIDPFLSWATYVNNGTAAPNQADVVESIKCSSTGEYYVGGYTESAAGISTAGVYQTSASGLFDGFIAKYSSGGTILWSSYFGGSDYEYGRYVAIGPDASVYLVGYSLSSEPTGGNSLSHLMNAGSGTTDIFVCKFNAGTGTRVWSLFYGGTNSDNSFTATCDPAGNLYVAGDAHGDGLSTDTTYLNGASDGILLKYNSSGTLMWATYVGGPGDEYISSVETDGANNVIVTGRTTSRTGLSTAGVFQDTLTDGADVFVAKYSPAGVKIWATYYGGPGNETPYAIVTETEPPYNIYVAGATNSLSGIASGPSFQPATGGGGGDGFLAKIDATGTALLWGTYFGGPSGNEAATGVVYDGFNVTIVGCTRSTSGLPTAQGYQTTIGGSDDAFVAKFNVWGQNLYASYFGSTGSDKAWGISFDPTDNNAIVIAGETQSPSGISTIGTGFGGGGVDGFIAKFAPDTLVSIRQPFLDTIVCQGGTLIIHDSTNYDFRAGNNFTVQLSDDTGSFAAPVTIGSVTATSSGPITCTIPTGTPPGTRYRIRIVSSLPSFISPDDIKNITIVSSVSLAANIFAVPDTFIASGTTVTFTAMVTGGGTINYQWFENNVAVAGATTSTYTATSLTHNDTVRCEVTTNVLCADSGRSNTVVVHVVAGLANVDDAFQNITLSPNPTHGYLLLSGSLEGTNNGEMTIEVSNVLGQVIFNGKAVVKNGVVNTTLHLPDSPGGMYFMHMSREGEGAVLKFMIE